MPSNLARSAYSNNRANRYSRYLIRRSIGAGARILPGVAIGDHAVIGAGAVVTHSVEPWKVVAGVPARSVRARRVGRALVALAAEDLLQSLNGFPVDLWNL